MKIDEDNTPSQEKTPSQEERSLVRKRLTKYFDKNQCSGIEKGFYQYAKEYCKSYDCEDHFSDIYHDNLENILYNFRKRLGGSGNVIENIRNGKIDPGRLAFMTREELDPENWESIIKIREESEKRSKNLSTVDWRKCKRCGTNKYFYQIVQIRRMDEASTIFYTCRECNAVYKVNC